VRFATRSSAIDYDQVYRYYLCHFNPLGEGAHFESSHFPPARFKEFVHPQLSDSNLLINWWGCSLIDALHKIGGPIFILPKIEGSLPLSSPFQRNPTQSPIVRICLFCSQHLFPFPSLSIFFVFFVVDITFLFLDKGVRAFPSPPMFCHCVVGDLLCCWFVCKVSGT